MIDLRVSFDDQRVDHPFLLKLYDYSEEDFDRMAPEMAFCELLDGTLIMPSPVGIGHQRISLFVAELLSGFCRRRRIGEVFCGPAVMHLAPNRKFEPNVMVVLSENRHRIGAKQIQGPCDLTIEVLSESTRDYDLGEKAAAYRNGGVLESWFIDPRDEVVIVDRGFATRSSHSSGELTSVTLAGFSVQVEWLWTTPLPDPQECLSAMLARIP